jgi:RHS repeat-associated protein
VKRVGGLSIDTGKRLASDVQYPGGISIHRDYTSRGQLKSVTDNLGSQPVIGYTYLPDGKVDHADYGNGVHCAYGYDGRGMISSIQHTRGDGANLSSRTYWRDERDRITAYQKSTNNSVNPMENGRGDRFRYDEEGQLVEAWYNASNPSSSGDGNWRYDAFNYDALGNRRGANYVQTKGWTQYTRRDNGLNQYNGSSPSFFTQYDEDISGWGAPQQANGVLMEDGNIVAGYNALNQPMLINTQALGSNWMFFGYDPLGRCVKRWVGALPSDGTLIPPPESNPATYFYYEGWNLIQEGGSFANATKNYVHGGRVDEIVKQIRPTDWWERYFHYDARGHCTLQTDSAGNIVEQYEYDAFGQPYFYDSWGNNVGYSAWGNRFLFTGREWLSDLKLYDYRNRLYQPELGRFMQPDPKEFGAGDYNLYRYCHNDPINKSDPTGMYEEDVHLILTEYLAVNAGFSQESAHAIAVANQRTDTNSLTSPYLGGGDARRAYHFTSEARRQIMRKEAFDTKSEEKFGQYLHALQDSYSHQRGGSDRNGEPYGANLGHIGDGHAPDKTSKRPELANKMAKDTYNEMRRFYQNQTGKEAPDNWNTIEKPVNVFVRTPR